MYKLLALTINLATDVTCLKYLSYVGWKHTYIT